MAAEAILSALLPVILDKLISPSIKQLVVAFGYDSKLQKLQRILEGIQSVVVDAEERQATETSIKNWLSTLKDLTYEAEDVLEEFEFEAKMKQRSLNRDNNMRRKVLLNCSFYKRSTAKLSLCRRLNDIIEKIEAIADEIHKFNFQLNKVPQISYGRPPTHSYVDQKKVIGREKDKEDIVSFLINPDANNRKNIAVLPIVAMGGIGKTTLSQLVYGDHRVEFHFQLRIWVCVSDTDFDVARLVKLIIDAATKEECKLSNMELLQQKLREEISGKRYLIVLDDVWNEDPTQWEGLKTFLDWGGEGSAVIVSTRSPITAKLMATHTIHYLKQLPEEDCWELFRRKAFVGAEEPANLVKIGKDIVKRCAGVSLAIDTIGSMMRLKDNDEEKWKAVLGSKIWEMKGAEKVMPALRLSYNYLPSHLKQCFAFCSIYPKDYVMEKDTLIQLWMANGYIPSDGNRDLETLGSDIYDELIFRSFFQNEVVEDHWYRGYSGALSCKMHDLMHDLAQSIMGKECLNFSKTPKWEEIPSTARHLLTPYFPESRRSGNQPILPTIRTIVQTKLRSNKKPVIKFSSGLKSLRVLSSFCVKIVGLSHFKHLRWLNLTNSNIRELPEGICSLYNLQYLILCGCYMLQRLPDNLTDLVNLRYLDIRSCNRLVRMPRRMGHLKQLHTLTRYIVSVGAERGLEQLRDLNLGGILQLDGIDKVRNAKDAEDAGLSSKHNLHSIRLSWGGADSIEVFEALKPHNGLKNLEVLSYGGQKFPKWMYDPQQLQNLVKIDLNNCGKCKELPPLGQLPLLEKLSLNKMPEVKHIISKTTWCDGEFRRLFPSLKVLYAEDIENLEDWCEADGSNAQILPDMQFFPCLMRLSIYRCRKLTTLPGPETVTKLTKLTLDNCDGFTSLPGGMESLINLSITECKGLASLPEGLIKLSTLYLRECDGLVSLPQGMESLIKLRISKCKGLTSLPEAEGLRKLSTLKLREFDGSVSLPQGMESLINLEISKCKGLTSLPEGLIKLSTLYLRECDGLVSLPQGMESLIYLQISKCKGLTSLPEGLIKLSTLELEECDGLVSLPQGMESLIDLQISKCKGLTSLPEDLKKLSKLKLDECDSLVSLPEGMECFTQLEFLNISKCNRLRSLPEALRVRLPNLRRLEIIGHGEFIRPFQYGGDYWRLIENIPHKYLQKHRGRFIF